MQIKKISQDQRPRERLQKSGSESLSDAELLAIILQTGTKYENVIDLSYRLLSKFGINKLENCTLKELTKINGIGNAKACKILAMFQLQKRFQISKFINKSIKSAKDVYDFCSPNLKLKEKEHIIVLHLDTKNKIIKNETISIGTLNSSLLHPREVFRSAIKENVNSIILVHNHPSGDSKPSDEDIKITEILTKTGELLSIKLLDHVIIGQGEYYSFCENKN
jgi:DNA repair protein RadC